MPPPLVAELALLGPGLAQDDRVDRLKVRGVGGEREMEAAALEVAVGGGAKVVLDVARAPLQLRRPADTLELGEDGSQRLVHDMGEDVEPPAMRHPDDDLLHPEAGGVLEDGLGGRNRRFGSVQTEALGSGEALGEELLELLGDDDPLQNLGPRAPPRRRRRRGSPSSSAASGAGRGLGCA